MVGDKNFIILCCQDFDWVYEDLSENEKVQDKTN